LYGTRTRWWWMADSARWAGSTDRMRGEFLAGAASGQAAEQACSQQELRAQRQGCEWTGDSAGLRRAIGKCRRAGGLASQRRRRSHEPEVSSTQRRPR
jgi:Cdc6-like AAA superfamily ATPase